MSDYDDVLLFCQFGSHTKNRPNNLVIGRIYDHHIYGLVEVGVEKFKSLESFKSDKRVAPCMGSKPFVLFSGEGLETFEELKLLKEVLHDLLHREIVENLNLSRIDLAYVCTALSPNRVFLSHCALRLKKSGSIVPRMELVEVGPSMDLVVRKLRLPNDSLKKEAMETSLEKPRNSCANIHDRILSLCLHLRISATCILESCVHQENNVSQDVHGKTRKIYVPDHKLGDIKLHNRDKGVNREAKMQRQQDGPSSKRQKEDSD